MYRVCVVLCGAMRRSADDLLAATSKVEGILEEAATARAAAANADAAAAVKVRGTGWLWRGAWGGARWRRRRGPGVWGPDLHGAGAAVWATRVCCRLLSTGRRLSAGLRAVTVAGMAGGAQLHMPCARA